jgi:hypothetical protein
VTSIDRARAFWTVSPGRGELRDETLGRRETGDVLVRAELGAISRGTEALVFNGRVPPAEYTRMRAPFQEGAFPGPVKYGYSNVGVVVQGPDALVGQRVFTLYPHQTHYIVPADAVHVIPDDVPSARAVLAANMETALNSIWDARPHVGDRVTVVGAGVVGCLAAWLAGRIAECDVTLVDINPARRHAAEVLGVRFSTPDGITDTADLVIHASGAVAGFELALNAAAFEATIVEVSWYGDAVVPAPLGGAFHARRLTVKSSQVGHVAASQRARWGHRRRMALALAMLRASELDMLITGESPFESLPDVMARLASEPGDALCHRIRYQ